MTAISNEQNGEKEQILSNPELLFDNEVPPDVTLKQGEKLNVEFNPEYCTIAPLTIVCVQFINTPEQ